MFVFASDSERVRDRWVAALNIIIEEKSTGWFRKSSVRHASVSSRNDTTEVMDTDILLVLIVCRKKNYPIFLKTRHLTGPANTAS